jgi:hypothetical protein
MKFNTFLFLGVAILATSCFDAPQFPDAPKIEFKSIIFKDLTTGSDSLNLFIDFEDGDGDLGLATDELEPPFHQKSYFLKSVNSFVAFNDTPIPESDVPGLISDLLKLSDKNIVDSLPDYSGDQICLNWDTNLTLQTLKGQSIETTKVNDTIYFQFNKMYHNIFVEYFVDRGTGFQKFDWRLEIDCSTNFDGRFPILNDDGKPRPLEGTIKYGMVSVGFKSLFKDDLMKLKVTILDRSGKYSNTIETPPFRLSDID